MYSRITRPFREVLVRICGSSASARIVLGILPLQRIARAKRRNATMHRAETAGITSSPGRTSK
jgi:hypothetical protein